MNSAKALGAACLVGFAAMNSQSAVAFDSGWYGGLGVGLTMSNIDDGRITSGLRGQGLTVTSINDDERDIGYKAFGGYKFTPNFALEGGYFDLGKFSYSATTSPAGTSNGSTKLSGFNVDAVGILPLTDKFSAFGRIGAQYAKAKDSFSGNGAASFANSSPSKGAANYKLGAGVQYDFTDNVGLRTEWERYRINDAVGNRGDIDMLSVGLVVMFGGSKPAHAARTETPPPLERHESVVAASAPPKRTVEPEPVVAASPLPAAAQPEPVVAASPPPAAADPEPFVAAAPVVVIVPVAPRTQLYCSILDIQFEINGDAIQRQDQEKIDKVAIFMKKYPDTTAVIEGHTDEVGTSADNMKLSQRRADSVVNYLANRSGIARSRLKAVGYGETRPIANPKTEEGRRLNRRVDAVISLRDGYRRAHAAARPPHHGHGNGVRCAKGRCQAAVP